ncbi:hypothetical protein [Vibrio cholerae]|uniref:hypothetical protein n=1 Tax=Vibrio cholerae TaxID=666 RepID=UPI000A1F8031|nr:hypothetical protein [Vibrio cholerae]EJL6360352.1 hypothetical protein [Vibrio cholerae]MCD6656732.1 hypothetical protein [Vibrio cholerae]OSP48025.1 hypothetical protein B7937_03725 [Vibrio cholerae]RAL27707.1 hypothetical protein DOE54_15720 [Vibrio cholerae]TQP80033.1 hypothetical protein FLL88_13625 [Vibrio cholerae]
MFSNTYIKTADFPKSNDVQLFAWPVYSWEVYLSSHKGRELNLFERTILELIRVTDNRELSSSQIAEWLSLEKEMVLYILTATMQPNGWLDKNFKITEEGRKVLDSETEPEMTTASVFQCALTGQWFPRIAYETKEIEPEKDTKKLVFKLDRATDKRVSGYRVNKVIHTVDRPSYNEINDLLSKDKEARWIANNISDERYHTPIKAEKVVLSNKDAKQSYLLLWADISSGYKFDFIDPFSLSCKAPWMNELFDKARAVSDKLELFSSSIFNTEKEELSYSETIELMKETARVEVLTKYPNAERIEGLVEALFELMNGKERLNLEKNADYSLNRSLINGCGSVLEFLSKATLNSYPLMRLDILPDNRFSNYKQKKELEWLLKELGKFSQSQIDNILKVQPGKIYQTAKGNNSSLRSLLATIFISMRDYPHHPFEFMIRGSVLFEQVYELSHVRDEASHGNSTRFTNEQALYYINVVDKVLENILAD